MLLLFSGIVRQLDVKQIRLQEAIAFTQDILNIKDYKMKIIQAIDEKNLTVAVNYIRQVHEIDIHESNDENKDFIVILEKEKEVKALVQKNFANAIGNSDIKEVMSLCPLLQTLGLESDARDKFLDFVENNLFVAISADAASVEGATDPATAYAHSLSHVFNSAYLIIQQNLPMVIQGMENSQGDIYFIRKLHKKCQTEAGLVLKRYMKFRNVKEIISSVRNESPIRSGVAGKAAVQATDIHMMLDELALLTQYSCRYNNFMKQVCLGAEQKKRGNRTETAEAVKVFDGPTEFDKMVDELINKYYLEGEQYLIGLEISRALPKQREDAVQLDECFFVLQKCALRAVATNNTNAACAVLNFISDLISSELLEQASTLLSESVANIATVLQDQLQQYKRTANQSERDMIQQEESGLSLKSIASTITGATIDGELTSKTYSNNSEDPWGIALDIDAFNSAELCGVYSERLGKDIYVAAQHVFGENSSPSSFKPSSLSPDSPSSKSSDLMKVKLCKEGLDLSKKSFGKVSNFLNGV